MVKVSVVMPVYNGAGQLGPTMESIVGQTLTDFELIVVDDGSTDATPEVLAEYVRQDSRIRVIRQQNSGITRALIRGCEEALAPLIARHDCGDRSKRERLENQSVLMNDPAIVLSACATTFRAPSGEMLYASELEGETVRRSLRFDPIASIRGLPHHGSAMFRREGYRAAGGYRAEFYFAQDLDLWIRLAQTGSITITKERLYEAFIDTEAISSRNRAEQIASAAIAIAIRDGGSETVLLARAKQIRPRPSRSRDRRRKARALYFIASCLRRNGDPAWKRYLRDSLKANPVQFRGWLLAVRGR